jgi:hypothetical protein
VDDIERMFWRVITNATAPSPEWAEWSAVFWDCVDLIGEMLARGWQPEQIIALLREDPPAPLD